MQSVIIKAYYVSLSPITKAHFLPNKKISLFFGFKIMSFFQEYELQCLNDQLRKLAVLEAENSRKDDVITELRRENTAYKKNSWGKDIT